jgi:CubicO group peptidase (beta-lactamase class C family)
MIVTDWQARHGLSDTDYQTAFDDLFKRGYRLIKVTGTAPGGVPRFSGIWQRRGGNAWQARHGISEADYQSTFATLNDKGYRLTHVNAFKVGSAVRFNAIWEHDYGVPSLVRHRLNGDEYQAMFEAQMRKGWRLRCVSGYEEAGEDRYACIWEEYAGPGWIGHHRLDGAAWQQEFDQHARDGFRLIQTCGYTMHGRQLFAGVWEQSPGHGWWARHGLPEAQYQGEFDAGVHERRRLVDVSMCEAGSGVAYTTIWEDARPDDPSGDVVKGVVTPFMQKWAVPGLAVSVSRNGSLTSTRTFGYANAATREIVTPATRFRVASVSKPITSAAIYRLIELGKLALTDRIFGTGARLGTTFGTTPYGLWVTNIELQHLLQHTPGAWPNDGMDPMGQQLALSANDLISWTLDNRPISVFPGLNFSYSNFGYCVLGRVIEAVTGQPYDQWVRTNILAPSGATDMRLAGNTGPDRQWPEAMYRGIDDEGAYGMNVRRMDAHGGWLATSQDVLRFGVRVDGFSPPPDILQAATITDMMTPCPVQATYASGWGVDGSGTRQHNGLLPGTMAILRLNGGAARHAWAAACNTGQAGTTILGEFLTAMQQVDAVS